MRRLLTAVLICVAGWSASGCALRTSDRGVGPLGDSEAFQGDSLENHIQKIRHLSARPAAIRPEPSRIEQQDQELATALLRLAQSPSAERHRVAAERYRALGVADAAYEHFNRAVAMDRRDAAAHDGLARVWRDWGFPGLALGDAHRAVFFAPRSAAARNTLGTVLQALGQDDSARRAYEEATTLDPTAVFALSNLCYLSFLRGDFENAVATCRSALEIDPGFVAARNNLALAYAGAGDLELARAEFMKASEEATGLFNTGILHMSGRNYADAVKAFDAATRADPSMNVARDRAKQARRLERGMDRTRR